MQLLFGVSKMEPSYKQRTSLEKVDKEFTKKKKNVSITIDAPRYIYIIITDVNYANIVQYIALSTSSKC